MEGKERVDPDEFFLYTLLDPDSFQNVSVDHGLSTQDIHVCFAHTTKSPITVDYYLLGSTAYLAKKLIFSFLICLLYEL